MKKVVLKQNGRKKGEYYFSVYKKDNKYIVVLSESETNKGRSITNAFEDVATIVYTNEESLFPATRENIIWVEYIKRKKEKDVINSSYTIVNLLYDPHALRFYNPEYDFIMDHDFDELIADAECCV